MDNPVADPTQDQSQGSTAPADDESAGTGESDTNLVDEATWKKRLNGQTAAAAQARRERDELAAKLSQYEAAQRSADDAKLVEATQLREALDKERAARSADAEAHRKALLSIKYPKATAEFTTTDEAELATPEGLQGTGESGGQSTPPAPPPVVGAPRSERPDKTREETSQDIFERLKQIP